MTPMKAIMVALMPILMKLQYQWFICYNNFGSCHPEEPLKNFEIFKGTSVVKFCYSEAIDF